MRVWGFGRPAVGGGRCHEGRWENYDKFRTTKKIPVLRFSLGRRRFFGRDLRVGVRDGGENSELTVKG